MGIRSRLVLALGLTAISIGPVVAEEVRIDTFDKKSNRTGYIVIDPQTGRLDHFDTKGNRLGYGTTTTPPDSYTTPGGSGGIRTYGPYDSTGRTIERRR